VAIVTKYITKNALGQSGHNCGLTVGHIIEMLFSVLKTSNQLTRFRFQKVRQNAKLQKETHFDQVF
jgi:hypothetical protein